jgi:predicted RNA-binding Zn-ribbon protein involved in translation (DUF1610 family)
LTWFTTGECPKCGNLTLIVAPDRRLPQSIQCGFCGFVHKVKYTKPAVAISA